MPLPLALKRAWQQILMARLYLQMVTKEELQKQHHHLTHNLYECKQPER
jgi:hypothetical protein